MPNYLGATAQRGTLVCESVHTLASPFDLIFTTRGYTSRSSLRIRLVLLRIDQALKQRGSKNLRAY
jgi:hypothetical protein